jgi:Ran GTPase-activating protein (RanGAP) involved in mRNA processing and transport
MSIFLENEFCKNLITLDLSSNKISNESIKKISHSLNYFLNLKKLNLANNFLKHSIKDLFDWKNPNLTYLDLTNCQIEDYEFNDELINNLENLSHLVLNKNLLGKRAIKFCFSLKSLISLYLSLCGLNDDDSFSLIKDIRNTNLKMLSLSNNDITSETIISLFKNQIFQKLYILDLFGNQLNDFFVDYLIKNKNNIPIQVLNIGLNHKISSEKKMQIYGLFKKYTKVTNKGNYT